MFLFSLSFSFLAFSFIFIWFSMWRVEMTFQWYCLFTVICFSSEHFDKITSIILDEVAWSVFSHDLCYSNKLKSVSLSRIIVHFSSIFNIFQVLLAEITPTCFFLQMWISTLQYRALSLVMRIMNENTYNIEEWWHWCCAGCTSDSLNLHGSSYYTLNLLKSSVIS